MNTGAGRRSLNRSESFGAALPQRVGGSEEQLAKIEERLGASGQYLGARCCGDPGEAFGDIGAADEDDRVDPGAECRLHRARLVAAIEDRVEPRARLGLPRGLHHSLEPAGAGIDPGIGRAQQCHAASGVGGGFERRHGVGQGMDDNSRRLRLRPSLAQAARASSNVLNHFT
jgi:hypothetical protein